MDKLARVLLGPHSGEPQPTSAGGRVVEGAVVSYDAVTGVIFTVPVWDEGLHHFGPAPCIASPTPPAAGDRCLVCFVGQGIETPWVIGWWPT